MSEMVRPTGSPTQPIESGAILSPVQKRGHKKHFVRGSEITHSRVQKGMVVNEFIWVGSPSERLIPVQP